MSNKILMQRFYSLDKRVAVVCDVVVGTSSDKCSVFFYAIMCIVLFLSCFLLGHLAQGSHKAGNPGIVRELCKPGKVRESLGILRYGQGNFFGRPIFRDLLIDELILACNM